MQMWANTPQNRADGYVRMAHSARKEGKVDRGEAFRQLVTDTTIGLAYDSTVKGMVCISCGFEIKDGHSVRVILPLSGSLNKVITGAIHNADRCVAHLVLTCLDGVDQVNISTIVRGHA